MTYIYILTGPIKTKRSLPCNCLLLVDLGSIHAKSFSYSLSNDISHLKKINLNKFRIGITIIYCFIQLVPFNAPQLEH